MNREYYRILNDYPDDDLVSLGNLRSRGEPIHPAQFMKGVAVDDISALTLEVKAGSKLLDFTFADGYLPVVRREYAEIITRICPQAVQLCPVGVAGRSEKLFIMNITSLVDCMDEKRSLYQRWTEADGEPEKIGQLRILYKLVVDAFLAGDADLFRLKGWEIKLLASAKMKAALANASGIQFKPVEVTLLRQM